MSQIIHHTDQRTKAVRNIFCIGRNYVEHIHELSNPIPDEPLVFLKPTSSLTTDCHIMLPNFSDNIHHEVEVVLLMGENNTIAAVAVGLDLTARDVQDIAKSKGLPWTKAKGFKNACWVGDFRSYHTNSEYEVSLRVNGEMRQHDTTAKMMYDFDTLVRYLDDIYGLGAGDLIFTGTPKGVGKLNHGDTLIASLSGTFGRQEYQITID